MNTSKTTWIKYPEDLNVSLHTLSFTSQNRETAFFTLGEEGKIELSLKKDDGVQNFFVLFHTPYDYLYFTKNKVQGSMFTVSYEFPSELDFDNIVLIKNRDILEFYSDNKLVIKLSNPAFTASTSLGFSLKGKGSVTYTVF